MHTTNSGNCGIMDRKSMGGMERDQISDNETP